MKSKRVNPRRRPATEADVEKAWEKGVLDGCNNASALFLIAVADMYDWGQYIPEIWGQINKLSAEVAEGRISFADLRNTLKEEYGIEA